MAHRWSRIALCAIFSLWAPIGAAQEPRLATPLEAGWRFTQAPGLSGVEAPAFDDARWSAVDVPHTWNRIGNEGAERSSLSNNVQGVGWYRLHFKPPRVAAGSRYFLQFDAVGAVAEVWLNGQYLGKHAGAFSRFRFDASSTINISGDNILAVKADNSRPQPGASTQDVIPLSGDFFVFGGIYRKVSLIVTRPVHVDLLDFGGPGLYARTLDINAAGATVQLSGRVANDLKNPRRIAVEFAIEDAGGAVVTSRILKTTATRGSMAMQTQLHVEHPQLWEGLKRPYLYRSTMVIRSDDGRILDRVSQPLGFRTVKFDPDRGFFLNGRPMFLKGASMHQDRPVKGWAISDADQRQDFDLLQDLGANAVRLAHYQHDQYSYELADARGIVVWAEIPLVNKVSFDGSPANAALTANAKQQLTELVRQNYNHPSIIVWSLGNEIDLTATQVKGPSRPTTLVRSLNELAKREDPSRATTLADCCEIGIPPHVAAQPPGETREPIVGIADTVGYNRYFGWYTGQFSDFGVMLDEAHAHHASLPISVSEYGAGAALTQHTDDAEGGPINPHGRPHPEEYQNWYHEKSWAVLKPREYLWGAFVWNLFDFSSDSRQEGDLTDINEKGLVSYDRQTRKDAFYFYRANWSAQPTLHLVGRRYVDRAYAVTDVKAYSNAGQARLVLNGREIGYAPCSDGMCLWRSVKLSEGANELTATAQISGAAVMDSLRWSLSHSDRLVNIKAGDISGYTAEDGQRFGSDAYFVGGTAHGINPPDTPPPNRVAVLADDGRMYDSFREGEFSYRIPLPNGRYRVRLKFVEPTATAPGERMFDVTANGVTQLHGFDVLNAAGGKLKGVDRLFDTGVDNGVLILAFQPRRGSALVSALSITPLAPR
ncbi:MAG TPA: glycoside hydrolase family 2 TIM barrel-domain containing protein [Steroidobacteraceae bacterium]|nr:glycoside hydrolase family 2 TIM barrel-domain containing protein [Steroidobacteraceae bacterium]